MLSRHDLRAGVNAFSLRYAALLGPENALISPLAVCCALLALVPAMSPQSRLDTLRALGLEGNMLPAGDGLPRFLPDDSPAVRKALASAVFYDRAIGLSAAFAAGGAGQAGKYPVDFSSPAAPEAVNAWVRESTAGRIAGLVSAFPPQTYLALASALYYADTWAESFETESTREGLFHGGAGRQTVRFMECGEALYTETGDFQAVLLPTTSGGGLFVFLGRDAASPKPVFPASAAAFDGLDWRRRPGRLLLPRFAADDRRSCADDLKRLGLAALFESSNPLSGLFSGGVPARLDAVLQSAVIRVDEHGLEAAAAAVAYAVGSGMAEPEPPFQMICDRPFSYLVFDRNEDQKPCILFAGFLADIVK